MVTQIKRVYWRGETTTACAICSDFITKNSACAREAKTKKRNVFLSVIGVQAQGWNKTKIKTLVYAVKKMLIEGRRWSK